MSSIAQEFAMSKFSTQADREAAILAEVARLRRLVSDWVSFAMDAGQIVGCLASVTPSANDHILRKLTHSNRLAFIGLQAWALENGYSGATDDEAYAAWLKAKEIK